ncbi:pyrimidine reductase riboflavin biosynthesis RibD [Candidatus Nitrosoglobus terrae]|uniref:Pyrimidine reductase riboflavin biosynthesis RibD n=1 Tax=Candidatus Nitrosoglobus terrae TaxID=1630141 RepID=A0A1Q2SN56_9GAMM|nr:dihydrofolate reductase family protein [Candidatus Nitrosoglobus terrae]BAW80543.1 pyrimidine reductase riboflavin biosynthesis RibD [Candidatus Nitrosoglobus terrae]
MNIDNQDNRLLKLFPAPSETVALKGLYLHQELQRLGTNTRPFVYTNFITSLDGRISLAHPEKKTPIVPRAIANPRDWRLFQELAAQADVIITSGRYIRQLADDEAQDILPISEKPEYADLIAWRRLQGLSPQPAIVIVSNSLDIPIPNALLDSKRIIYVATSASAHPLKIKEIEAKGIRLLFAGNEVVQGRELIIALGQAGLTTIYMVAGPKILNTLLMDKMLNRLYLTHALKILGGESFDTLFTGKQLGSPVNFSLNSLYYDIVAEEKINQCFAVYDVVGC